jgi:hypothetical protein
MNYQISKKNSQIWRIAVFNRFAELPRAHAVSRLTPGSSHAYTALRSAAIAS